MISTLQSLRFVFVMLIFLSHFAYKDIAALDAGGDCGVAFFFILSGLGCSMGYASQIEQGTYSHRNFLKRRLVKFYPLHLFCLLFFLVVSHATLDLKVLLNALLLQSWIPDPNYYFSCNSVAWFLSSLMFSYMFFPFAYRFASGLGLIIVLIVYLAVCLLVPYHRVNAILYVHPIVRFVDFYIGVVLYRMCIQRGRYLPASSWAEGGLVLLLLVLLAVYPYIDAKVRNAPLYWIVLVPMLLVFVQEKGMISRLLDTTAMKWLGTLSMSVFLTHQLLLSILFHRLPEMSAPLMLFVCLVIVLTLSWGMQKIFSLFYR